MKHYWNGDHDRQKEYQDLYDKFVPHSGKASTVHGELIRSISRLYYEYCNNGNMNAYDEEKDEITERYQYFINFIRKYINCLELSDIEDVILSSGADLGPNEFSDRRMSPYDKVTDAILDYIKSNPDEVL